jgi:probable F420-dependent oxidoreductase
MDQPIRFIVRLPHTSCLASRDAIVRVADAAEDLGFWGVSVQDHLLADAAVSPCGAAHDGDDRNVFEALQVLGFLAGRTERIRLLAGVFVVPFRNVFWLAKEIAALDVLSEGRLVCGVGVGALRSRKSDGRQNLDAHRNIATQEFDLLDVGGHRGRLMDEQLRALDLLLTQDAPSMDGEYIAFQELALYPKPVQAPRPPIWVGGRSEAAQRRAALLAEGWFPSQASVAVYREGRAGVERIAAEHGRPAPTDFGVNIYACADADGERARDVMRSSLGHRFQGDDGLFEATIAGTPEEVRARMAEYVAAGVNAFDLKFLPLTLEDQLAQMELFAREIFPALEA